MTADTAGISDTDGLTGAAFAYQWLADDATIGGATASTYTVLSGDVGKAIKVRVTFTDDAGNEESLTSAATAAVKQTVTASASNAPGSHDGQSKFTFELRFSEEFGISHKTLRDHAFMVKGGDVVKARRLNPPSSMGWEITVEPDGNAEVSVSLPTTTDCAREGAICTEDGRMLSSAVEVAVPGRGNQQQSNTPATGAPTISGTAQVGETLTASTAGISDTDGLTSAAFAYQWIAGESGISGATVSSYTLTSSEQGETIKVRVTFTDDEGNAESLNSAATGAVAAAPSPLTARTSQAPASHDGQTAFTFELDFSEEFSLSYRTLRDYSFTVTGGEVVKARRLNPPSSVGWEITVQPDGDGTVTIVLPITTYCAPAGAICTEDGRMLSNRLELTVSGP